MDLLDKRYIIGIDLGTTNSAVSFVDLEEDKRRIRVFRVPQMVAAGEFGALSVLPSFLYIPGRYDLPEGALNIPWDPDPERFAGAFARDHGASVPARLVSSAKSWLCHARADRRSRILPWGAGEEVYKISPVQATAALLAHIRQAWNRSMADEADLYLENQVVIITVPASFDEVARDLTLEGAHLAGIENVTLLEEPLAAFYNWLIRHEKDWAEAVRPGELILVCDVGGGTTDFTLITLREVDGSPRFERIAVGDHLLLGGDNIDLALARKVEGMFSEKRKQSLSPDRWKALCHQCRQAKEAILDGAADARNITLVGRGRKLISETLSARLDRDMVEETVLEGFFPLVAGGEKAAPRARQGITEFGLPYEPEPAVTRHLGWFMERHREDVRSMLGREELAPDLILFNGGSLKSEVVQERIRAAVRRWFDMPDDSAPRLMENPEPDLSVALGAAYYGLVKMGQGVKVGSGSPRAYYLAVANADKFSENGQGVGGGTRREAAEQAICLVERGLDEGSRIDLSGRGFEVLTNRPVSFGIYSSSYRSGDRRGDIIDVDDTMTPLPPLRTVIQFGKKGAQSAIPIHLEADYTEMGTLAVWCRSDNTDHRWRLQFQLREAAAGGEPAGVTEADVFDESIVAEVCARVEAAFAENADPRLIDGLSKEITRIVSRPRDQWPLGLIRRMADTLLDRMDRRKISHRAESRWLNMTGFCMRPGLGEGFDAHRVKRLWRIYKPGPVFGNNAQARSEWWIMWRRVAGGLQPGQQRQIMQDLTSILRPGKGGGKRKLAPQEELEIWMAVANMERLMAKEKAKWGGLLLDGIDPKKSRPQHVWALSRMGAREPLYGPVDRVVAPDVAARWMEGLMKMDWPDMSAAGPALVQMGRRTGDRVREIDPALRERTLQWLLDRGMSQEALRPLREVVAMAGQEQSDVFGESLPAGLVLREAESASA